MVEHDLLDREVLAFTWDGTGFGDDGTLWGGEVLRTTLTGFTRVGSLRPIPLPGGEAAVREPARIALVLAAAAVGGPQVLADRPLLERLDLKPDVARTLLRMAERGINCPASTGMGRLIDGLAALVLPHSRVTYEAEAAARLESICAEAFVTPYPILTTFEEGVWRGDWRPLVGAVLDDLHAALPIGVIAAKIHRALAAWARDIAVRYQGLPVVLGGGCFQNRQLTQWTREELERAGRSVYQPERVPGNDGGLAVGQLAVALAQLASAPPSRSMGGV
jgi:hydrogenase maturation protein HypF